MLEPKERSRVWGLIRAFGCPITYELTTTSDGQLYASIWGLSGGR